MQSRMRRFFLNNELSIVLLSIFLCLWAAMTIAGHHAYNNERRDHGEPTIGLAEYLHSGNFIEATAENWESEFLEMGWFAWLTACLVQKGSPESKAPGEADDDPPVKRNSPWPARRGGWVLAVYARSLSLAFFGLFLIAFCIHAYGGAKAYNHQQIAHGQAPISLLAFFGTSEFWFQSFQNWQSEFLGVFLFVVLSIYLRQRGSPESKPVAAPHSSNE